MSAQPDPAFSPSPMPRPAVHLRAVGQGLSPARGGTEAIETALGPIILRRSAGEGLPLLLFPAPCEAGPSAFAAQFDSPLGQNRRLMTLDRAEGWGGPAEGGAIAMAEAAVALVEALGLDEVVAVGEGVGGHAALELLATLPGVVGLMLVGFRPRGAGMLWAEQRLTLESAETPVALVDGALAADGPAMAVPVLWGGRRHRLPQAAAAPAREAAPLFNTLLASFAADMEQRAQTAVPSLVYSA